MVSHSLVLRMSCRVAEDTVGADGGDAARPHRGQQLAERGRVAAGPVGPDVGGVEGEHE